jgi:hypothetical protein
MAGKGAAPTVQCSFLDWRAYFDIPGWVILPKMRLASLWRMTDGPIRAEVRTSEFGLEGHGRSLKVETHPEDYSQENHVAHKEVRPARQKETGRGR